MKKILSLVLVLAMLLCGMAFADGADYKIGVVVSFSTEVNKHTKSAYSGVDGSDLVPLIKFVVYEFINFVFGHLIGVIQLQNPLDIV